MTLMIVMVMVMVMVRKMSIQRSNPVRVSWHMRQMLAMAAPSLLVSTANDRWQSRFIPPTPKSPKSLSLFTKLSNPKTALSKYDLCSLTTLCQNKHLTLWLL